MGLTFKQLQASDVSLAILNANEFAEIVSYTPAGGVARNVTAVCDESREVQENEHGLYRQAVLEVFVSRDATTGIATPSIGDAITRTVGGESQTFSWNGGATEVDSAAWTLTFVRNIPYERR